MLFNRLWPRKSREEVNGHSVPTGRRIYAVGDIHGRLDLLDALLAAIARDDRRRGICQTMLVFLGDFIDRGPDSRGVVQRLLDVREGGASMRFLMGNHEEILLRAYEGDHRAAALFHRVGGRETMLSYGVEPEEYDRSDFRELIGVMKRAIPLEHISFFSALENFHVEGDYVFVHAGIRPGVPLVEQSTSDLRWIRSEFLKHRGSHGNMIIHGHSVTAGIDEQNNRIGIDTGAYASGVLTAIGLEGSERWYLKSEDMPREGFAST